MDRGKRIDRSTNARRKRKLLKGILFDCMLRKYGRLRKLRRKRNNK